MGTLENALLARHGIPNASQCQAAVCPGGFTTPVEAPFVQAPLALAGIEDLMPPPSSRNNLQEAFE